VVQLLLGDEVVDRAIRAEGLAVRDLPPAAEPAGRSGVINDQPAPLLPEPTGPLP